MALRVLRRVFGSVDPCKSRDAFCILISAIEPLIEKKAAHPSRDSPPYPFSTLVKEGGEG
jgi:hypothetical protein